MPVAGAPSSDEAARLAAALNEWRRTLGVARDAFAHLLFLYRDRAKLSQLALAKAAGVSQSYIASLEKKTLDPPRNERLARFAAALHLSPLERNKLSCAARGVWTLHAPFLFLDTDAVGEEVDYEGISMLWILGSIPLEFQQKNKSVYRALRGRVCDERTRFVYWIPSDKKDEFDRLVDRLERDLEKNTDIPKSRVASSLECILTPDLLCVHQCALYNPLNPARFGRLGITSETRDEIMAAAPMSPHYTRRVYDTLRPAYDALRTANTARIRPENDDQDDACMLIFRRYYPVREE